jgi:hypothetical protein
METTSGSGNGSDRCNPADDDELDPTIGKSAKQLVEPGHPVAPWPLACRRSSKNLTTFWSCSSRSVGVSFRFSTKHGDVHAGGDGGADLGVPLTVGLLELGFTHRPASSPRDRR